ncbi:MAG: DUF2089 family protein [Bacteroidia bacterium]
MLKPKLPTQCPGCSSQLHVAQLACPECSTQVSGTFGLPALARLTEDEQEFIIQFVISGGSLKEMAAFTGVSYPTVRNRLDDLIQKIKANR